jgi:predicted dehydrogenase
VASDTNDQNGISRRDFTARLGVAAAGIAVGGELFSPLANAAPAIGQRVIGANDRVVVANIGIRGQGNALKTGFARLKNVEVKTLCDIDENLAASRINDKRVLDTVPTFKPNFVQDLRRVMEDKDIDAVVIATPNHWHALATAWALQSGKHVYVEKPSTYTVWEGRNMVQAAEHYKKIVQVGTMNRSRNAVRQAIQFIRDGGIGKVYMARGLCFKSRPPIGKYPDGPMGADEKYSLTVNGRPDPELSYTAQYLSKVDYDLWLGPAPKRAFNRNRFHYNWHWHWDYGNGDTGNQGPHQFDIARWGLGKQEHPVKVASMGGYFGPEASQETPNVHDSMFTYADGTILEFSTRGTATNNEGSQRIGNLFYGDKGWLYIDGDGRDWQSYLGPASAGDKAEKGPGSTTPPSSGSGSDPNVLTSIESGHYGNFIDAIRANDPKILTCDALEGHLSSSLPHLANISYRVGRQLAFDGKKEQFVNDKEADKLLTREYRKGFEVPKSYS